MDSPARSGRIKRLRRHRLVLAVGALALTASPAVAAIVEPPGAGVSIITGVNTSFVAVEGLPAAPHTVEVWRAGTKIATSASIIPAGGVIEINHLLEPDCWQGVTPDIRPGDQVRALTAADTGNQSVARDIQLGLPVRTGPTQVQLHGIAATPAGAPLPIAELGGLVRNTAITGGGNGGGVRWLVPGPQASIAYDVANNPTGTKFTITVNFDGTKGIGGAQTEADVAMAGDVIEAEWASAALNEITFADANGVSGPNGAPCTQAAQPLQQGPTNVRLTAATDSGTSDTDGITNNTAPSITGTVSIPPGLAESKLVKLYLDGGTTPVASNTITTLDNGTFTIPLPDALAPGVHTVLASEVDTLIGPIGPVETTSKTAYTFTVDTSAPAAPSVSQTVPAGPANNNAPLVQGTSPEAGSIVSIFTDAACTTSIANGTAAAFAAPGIAVAVADNTTTQFFASANDLARNGPSPCSATGVTYVEDSVAPAPPVLGTVPPLVTNDATPEFNFTGEAGASFTCSLSTGADSFTACSSPVTYAAQPAGLYTFKVRATDAAGNTSVPATRSLTLDLSPPAAPALVSFPPLRSNDQTPTFGFTGEVGATFECSLSTGVDSFAPCVTPVTFPSQPEGAYTFKVRQTDLAGNLGPAATRGLTIDVTPPGAAVITSGPPVLTNNATPTFAFTGELGATFRCSLESGADQFADCASPFVPDPALVSDGSWTFKVLQVDEAGNPQSAAPATYTFALDTTPPSAPVFGGGNPPAQSNDSTPTFVFSGELSATFECSLSTGADAFGPCTAPFTAASQPEGVYAFKVRATDQAGNVGPAATRSWTLDLTPPAAPSLVTPPALVTNDATPTFAFTGEPAGTFSCSLSTGPDAFAPCTSPLTYAAQPAGAYTFKVRQTDVAGNPGAVTSRSLTIDLTPPAAAALGATPPALTNDTMPTFAFTGEPGATFQCSVSNVTDAPEPCTSPYTRVPELTPDGSWTFKVWQTDEAGNEQVAAPASFTFTLDSLPPALPTFATLPPLVTNDTTPTFAFTGEPGATFECSLLGGFAACASPLTVGAIEGTHTFTVRAVDAAGNRGPEAMRSITIDTTLPTVPSLVSPPATIGNDATPTFAFAGEPSATFQCSLTTGADNFTGCTSPFTATLLVAGDYVFKVRQIDQATNVGPVVSRPYSLDLTPPAVPTFTALGSTSPANNNAPLVLGSAEPGSEVRLYGNDATCAGAAIGGPVAASVFATPGAAINVLDNTTTQVRATATDVAGNVSPCSPVLTTFVEDSTPPAAAGILTGPPPVGTSRDVAFSFAAVSLIPGLETLECSLSNGVDAYGPCDSTTTFARTGLPDGAYTFKTKVNDGFGNDAISTRSFTIDNIGPSATILSGPGEVSSDTTPTFNFAASEVGSTFECGVAQTGTPTFAPCATPLTLGPLALGDWSFSVRAKDAAGNVGVPATAGFRIQADAPALPVSPVIGAPSVTTRRAVVRNNRVVLEIRCTGPAGASCSGTVDVNRVIAATATRRSRTVRYGRANATIQAGQTVRVTVTLNGSGRVALKAAKRLTLKTVVTPKGAVKPSSFPLTLTLPVRR